MRELWAGASTLPWEKDLNCQLAVAEFAPMSLATVAEILGMSRQRVHQIEMRAMRKLRLRMQLEPSVLDGMGRDRDSRKLTEREVEIIVTHPGRVMDIARLMNVHPSVVSQARKRHRERVPNDA